MPGVCIVYRIQQDNGHHAEFFRALGDFHAKEIAPGVRFANNALSVEAIHDLLRPHLGEQDMLLVFTAVGPGKWTAMPDPDWPVWLEKALRVPRRR